MWIYEKKLQFPAWVEGCDLKIAGLLFAQYGGPDSELSAGLRYLTQRYTMPIPEAKAVLTKCIIFTKEVSMVEAQYQQLSMEDIDLKVGDRLYKEEKLYAEVVGISSSLYFLDKPGSTSGIPDARMKEHLIKEILYGSYRLEQVRFG